MWARQAAGYAADFANQADEMVRGVEDGIVELNHQPEDGRQALAPDVDARVARDRAKDLWKDVFRADVRLLKIRENLERSAACLAAGRKLLEQAGDLPDQRNEQLRGRLEKLEGTVKSAMEGVDAGSRRISAALDQLDRVVNRRPGTDVYQVLTADDIREVAAQVEGEVRTAGDSVEELRAKIREARKGAYGAARDSSDLAKAIRAGTNPTPQSAQQKRATAGEQDRRQRPDGPAQTLDR